MNRTPLTSKGFGRLKEELHLLKTQERPTIIQAIAEARAHGDLSENAEYDAAKEAQGLLEAKIAKLETILASSRIMDTSKVDSSKVNILSTVKCKNLKINKEVQFTIVSEKEANLKQNKISSSSPIGKALLGKKVGDSIEVKVPAGLVGFEILEITL